MDAINELTEKLQTLSRVITEGNTVKKPTDRNLKLVQTLVAQISLVLEKAQLYQALQNKFLKLEQEIAERKKVDVKLAEASIGWKNTFDAIADVILVISPNNEIMEVNTAGLNFLKKKRHQIIGEKCYALVHQLDCPILECPCVASLKEKKAVISEFSDNNKRYESSAFPVFDKKGEITSFTHIIKDITERKKNEIEIIKINRLYFFISQISQLIVRITDEQTLFKEACNIAINIGKFRMAWIGLIDEKTKKVNPVMHAGEESGYLSIIKIISTADVPEGKGPTGKALQEGRISICNNIANDALMNPWKKEALLRGYCSSIAIPITKLGKVIGAFSLYASEINYFDTQEIALLKEVTGDISFALEVFENAKLQKFAEEKIIESEARLLKAQEIGKLGYWQQDLNSGMVWASKEAMNIYGFQDEEGELPKEKIASCIVDVEKEKQAASDLIEYNKEYNIEIRINPADGSAMKYISALAEIKKNESGIPIRIVGTLQDITERKKVENEILLMNKQLRDFGTHLENIREEERKNIAREIHDELGQQLAALKIDAECVLKNITNKELIKERTNEMIILIDETVKTVRHISSALRPEILDELGLSAALEWKVKNFCNRTGLKCNLKIDTEVNLSSQVSINVFRIIQESLTNIAKYAESSEVNLHLKIENKNLIVTISDDGKGFGIENVKQKQSFGIIGMKERAKMMGGDIQIQTQEGKGTTVKLIVPVETTEPH